MSTDVDAEFTADLMKAMNSGCSKCWRAEHRPPPASALYLMDDYKWDLSLVLRHEHDIVQLAMESGFDGSTDSLRYAAHREAYALSGNDADLARMLRHVTTAADASALPAARRPGQAVPRAPAHRAPLGSRGQVAAHDRQAGQVLARRRSRLIRGEAPWPRSAASPQEVQDGTMGIAVSTMRHARMRRHP